MATTAHKITTSIAYAADETYTLARMFMRKVNRKVKKVFISIARAQEVRARNEIIRMGYKLDKD